MCVRAYVCVCMCARVLSIVACVRAIGLGCAVLVMYEHTHNCVPFRPEIPSHRVYISAPQASFANARV